MKNLPLSEKSNDDDDDGDGDGDDDDDDDDYDDDDDEPRAPSSKPIIDQLLRETYLSLRYVVQSCQ